MQNWSSDSPLHKSAELGNTNTLAALLDKNANIDAQNVLGCSPLHVAAENGHVEALQELLNAGADANVRRVN